MKISIVTVSYNSAATIADTLRSVREQTHTDIEHIVVDGGSIDGTLAVVKREGAHVVRLLSEPDRGIYYAMNKGFALASGEMVGFLNADDMLASPGAIAAVAAAAAAENADLVYGDLLYVHKDRPSDVIRYWQSGSFAASRLRFGWMPRTQRCMCAAACRSHWAASTCACALPPTSTSCCGACAPRGCASATCRKCWCVCAPAVPATARSQPCATRAGRTYSHFARTRSAGGCRCYARTFASFRSSSAHRSHPPPNRQGLLRPDPHAPATTCGAADSNVWASEIGGRQCVV